jgi:hypothetical protein
MPKQRTDDVDVEARLTKLDTLGNMLKNMRFEPTARGIGVEGRVDPVEYRAMKNMGQPLSAGARVRVGPTEWDVNRRDDGTFAAKVTVTLPIGRRQ